MPAARLDVAGLVAGHGDTRIVQDVSLSVPAGGRVAVLGRNGMGKTTLLAALMGLARRHAGSIGLDGVEIGGLRTAERAARGLGYVPQTRDVFPTLTVEENLRVGLKERPRAALEEAYALFPRLRERRRNLGSQLSGGEQQMLSTARTLLGRPSVLLLDEPLEGLAPVICDQLMQALAQLTVTLILVEQQVDRALDFAQGVVILERGQVVHEGAAADLRDDHALMERHLGVALAA